MLLKTMESFVSAITGRTNRDTTTKRGEESSTLYYFSSFFWRLEALLCQYIGFVVLCPIQLSYGPMPCHLAATKPTRVKPYNGCWKAWVVGYSVNSHPL